MFSSSSSGFGDYEIWIVFGCVRVAGFAQLFQSFDLVLVSPDNPMLTRIGFSEVNPTLLSPVMDSLLNHTELDCKIGNPPFIFKKRFISKELAF